jgi:hypothetical protein
MLLSMHVTLGGHKTANDSKVLVNHHMALVFFCNFLSLSSL